MEPAEWTSRGSHRRGAGPDIRRTHRSSNREGLDIAQNRLELGAGTSTSEANGVHRQQLGVIRGSPSTTPARKKGDGLAWNELQEHLEIDKNNLPPHHVHRDVSR